MLVPQDAGYGRSANGNHGSPGVWVGVSRRTLVDATDLVIARSVNRPHRSVNGADRPHLWGAWSPFFSLRRPRPDPLSACMSLHFPEQRVTAWSRSWISTPLVRRVAIAQWIVLGLLFAIMDVTSYGLTPSHAALNSVLAILPAFGASVGLATLVERLALWRAPLSTSSVQVDHVWFIARVSLALIGAGYALSALWLGWLWLRLAMDLDAVFAQTFWTRWWSWQLHAAVWPIVVPAFVRVAERFAERAADWRVMRTRAEQARTQAELAVLRAHIRPHFLFNTLHALGGLVHTDPKAAERRLERLQSLLHHLLDHDRRQPDQTVSLAEEWAFAKAYLDLEADRLGDRLRLETRLSTAALSYQIPPFLIQPLVENAVRHAAGPRRDGACISVSAECAMDGRLTIEVADDGPGVLLHALQQHQGLGLRSVSQRIAALGPHAAFTLESSPGRGFTARIVLPCAPLIAAP